MAENFDLQINFDKLIKQIDVLTGKVEELEKALDETGDEAKETGDQLEGAGKKAKRAGDGAKGAAQNLTLMQKASLQLGKAVKFAVQSFVAFFAIEQIGSVFRGVVDATKNFQSSLADLSAITGATGEDLEFYNETAKELGRSTTVAAGEVVNAFKLVGSAKPELLSNKEALAQVTEQAILLSEASGLDLQTSVLSLTGALNQFGLGAEEASRFVNVLAAGSKEGAAAIPLIAETVRVAGTNAASANVSFEQLVGLTETLAEKSIVGAEAGTKLRNIILNLSTSGKGFVDGQFDILEALTQVRNEFDAIEDPVARAEAELKLFQKQNVAAGLVLLQNIDKFETYTGKVTGTQVAIEQAAVNTATFEAAQKRFLNTLNILAINIGTALLPVLNLFLGAVNTLVSLFLDLPSLIGALIPFNNLLSQAFKEIGEAIDAGVESISNLFGEFNSLKDVIESNKILFQGLTAALIAFNAQTILSTANVIKDRIAKVANLAISKALTLQTKLQTVAQIGLNAAFRANPIGFIITGVTLLISGFITLYKNSETVRNAFSGIVNAGLSVFETIKKVANVLTLGVFASNEQTKATKENTEATKENNEEQKKSETITKKQTKTVKQLKDEVEKLKKDRDALNESDEEALRLNAEEIKTIQKRIDEIENQTKVQEEQTKTQKSYNDQLKETLKLEEDIAKARTGATIDFITRRQKQLEESIKNTVNALKNENTSFLDRNLLFVRLKNQIEELNEIEKQRFDNTIRANAAQAQSAINGKLESEELEGVLDTISQLQGNITKELLEQENLIGRSLTNEEYQSLLPIIFAVKNAQDEFNKSIKEGTDTLKGFVKTPEEVFENIKNILGELNKEDLLEFDEASLSESFDNAVDEFIKSGVSGLGKLLIKKDIDIILDPETTEEDLKAATQRILETVRITSDSFQRIGQTLGDSLLDGGEELQFAFNELAKIIEQGLPDNVEERIQLIGGVITNATQGITDAIIAGNLANIEAIADQNQELIDNSRETISELTDILNEEIEKQNEGRTNRADAIKDEIEAEKLANERRIAEQERLEKRRIAIQRRATLVGLILKQTTALAEGIAQASAVPWPANIAAIASVVASVIATFAQVRSIFNSTPEFKEGTAFVDGPKQRNTKRDNILAWLDRGERVVDRDTNSQYAPLLDAIATKNDNKIKESFDDFFQIGAKLPKRVEKAVVIKEKQRSKNIAIELNKINKKQLTTLELIGRNTEKTATNTRYVVMEKKGKTYLFDTLTNSTKRV